MQAVHSQVYETTQQEENLQILEPYHRLVSKEWETRDGFPHSNMKTQQLCDAAHPTWDPLLIQYKGKREQIPAEPQTLRHQMWEHDVLIYATGSEEQCKRKENHLSKCLGCALAYWIRAPGRSAN